MSAEAGEAGQATPSSPDEPRTPDEQPEGEKRATEAAPDPVRRWTLIVAGACALAFLWYVVGDRFTPYTADARVRGYVVPIAPQVSGEVTAVHVVLNEIVDEGQELIQIDPESYQLAVESAQADLQSAIQDVGAGGEGIGSAEARVAEARADLAYDEVQTARTLALERAGVRSRAQADRARARLEQARARVASAEAELEAAREQLGSEGRDNPRIRAALASLSEARLDLTRTTIRAPALGGIANLRIEVGHMAQPGQPIMTFVSTKDVWVEAYMRENSIGRVQPGDPVELVLDVAPGRVFQGEVGSIGYGVDWGQSEAPGDLPKVSGSRGWLRDAQRFPVIVRFEGDAARGLRREGGQANVIIYTGESWILNALAWLWIRLVSAFSYVY